MQHVAYDYARRLAWGRQDADAMFSSAWRNLTGDSSLAWLSCDLANVTICPGLEAAQPTALIIYNSQAQPKDALPLRLPVPLPQGVTSYKVADWRAAPVMAQLLPLSADDLRLRTEYYNYTSPTGTPASQFQWLAFQAVAPPAGYSVYFIIPVGSGAEAPLTHISVPKRMRIIGGSGDASAGTAEGDGLLVGDQTLTNGIITLTISGTTGRVTSFANAATGVSSPLEADWAYYRSSKGGQSEPWDPNPQVRACGSLLCL